MGIVFQSGLGIGTIPSNGGGGVGFWNLVTGNGGYQPAYNNGDLTFPDHTISEGLSNPNLILDPLHQGTIYINQYDSSNTDQSSLLSSLLGNSGTIQFENGFGDYITFQFQSDTFGAATFGGPTAYFFDRYFGNSPDNLTVVSTSGTSFTDGLVQITISI